MCNLLSHYQLSPSFAALPHIISICFTLSPTLLRGQGTYSLSRHDFYISFLFLSIISFLLPSTTAMEDLNMLAADCVVISCCCQCLIFQLLIYFFLQLPRKMFRKTKEYALKKFRIRYRKKGEKGIKSFEGKFEDGFVELQEGSITIQVEDFYGRNGFGSGCMEEVERVIGEFSRKGEFAFGSFWGRGGGSSTCVAKQEIDFRLVQFELVEIGNNSFRYSN
ncbi:uncharacterized protein LOC105641944 [Jatropha curcas]|uniref:uncharacterized protein LOC105641944 n=1 Tax=Jatropha curcas TaxID=180498 RepID=UPI0005FC0D78|nr:uncharacterized protein LOC105641944 [Jatropha curcas]